MGDACGARSVPGNDLDNLLDESHRRPMRQLRQKVARSRRHRRDYKCQRLRRTGGRVSGARWAILDLVHDRDRSPKRSTGFRRSTGIGSPSTGCQRKSRGRLRSSATTSSALKRALCALHLPAHPTIISNVGNRTGFIPLFLASVGLGSSFLPLDGGASAREVFDLADAYGRRSRRGPRRGRRAFRRRRRSRCPAASAAISPASDRRSVLARAATRPTRSYLKVTSGSTGLLEGWR